MAGDCCPSVPETPLPLQPTEPFQPRFLLQELIRGHCPFQPRWSLHGSRVPLSHGCRKNRKRLPRSRRCQLLIVQRQAMTLPIDAQNTRCMSTTLASISLNAVGILCCPQCAEVVDSGCFVGAQHERTRHHPRGLGGAPRPRRHAAFLVAWTVGSRPPAFANSASDAALRDDTSYSSDIAAAVTITKRCGMRVLPNNQPSTSLHHATTSSLHHITASTLRISHLFTALFLSEPCDLPRPCDMAASQDKRTDNWHHRSTSTNTLISTPTNIPRKYKRKCSGRKRGNGRPFRRKKRVCVQYTRKGRSR